MRHAIARSTTAIAALGLVAAALTPAQADETPAVRLLGAAAIPPGTAVDGTPVGGLSGIDRDPATGRYVLVSDDRSEHAPARLYTAAIDVGADRPPRVEFTGARTLRDPAGAPYPSLEEFAGSGCPSPDAPCAASGTVDPESVRIDPYTGAVWWTTEGERQQTGSRVVLHPRVRVSHPDGTHIRELRTPRLLRMHTRGRDRGPRANLTLEGLTLTRRGTVVTALEGPLHQDGALPAPDAGAVTRITETRRDGTLVAQYGYPLGPIPATPQSPDGAADNGVSEILADPQRDGGYIAVERSYVAGHGNTIRLFRVDTGRATDISRVPALPNAGHEPRLAAKTLLADLGELNSPALDHLDNIEGITWGPRLPTGERALLLVSDDNFSANQQTQVIALALR